MSEESESLTEYELFCELVDAAYAGYYLVERGCVYVEFDDAIGRTTHLLTKNCVDTLKTYAVKSEVFPDSVLRLLQNVFEHFEVQIHYKIEITDAPPGDIREKEVTILVDVEKAGVDKLKHAIAVLAGFCAAATVGRCLFDLRDKKDQRLALSVARETLGLKETKYSKSMLLEIEE